MCMLDKRLKEWEGKPGLREAAEGLISPDENVSCDHAALCS